MALNKKREASTDLTEGSVFRLLLLFSLPIVATNTLQTTYNLVDMAIVGRYLGNVGLSAVSIGSDIIHMLTLVANGLSAAAQIIISQHMGARDNEAVGKSAGTIMSVGMIFGIFLTALMLFLNNFILSAMNTPMEAWNEAVSYTTTCYFGLIFIVGYGILSALLRGIGDSRHPLLFIIVTSVTNIVLDFVFVVHMDMGTFGAALATVIAQGISFVWALVFIYQHRREFAFEINLKMFRINYAILVDYIKLVIPMCLQRTLVHVANLYVNSFIYAYGVVAVAVSGIGSKLGTICQIFTNAFLQGGAAMVGQNIGAGKMDRVRKIVHINILYSVLMGTFFASVTILYREQIFGIFTTDPAVLEMTKVYLLALILKYYMFCARCPFMALINGIGKPMLNYILGIVDGLVLRIGCAFLFGMALNMGLQGFWYGNALGGFAPLLVGGIYFFSGSWEKDAIAKMKKKQAKIREKAAQEV